MMNRGNKCANITSNGTMKFSERHSFTNFTPRQSRAAGPWEVTGSQYCEHPPAAPINFSVFEITASVLIIRTLIICYYHQAKGSKETLLNGSVRAITCRY